MNRLHRRALASLVRRNSSGPEDVGEARRARAAKLRRLGAMGILYVALVLALGSLGCSGGWSSDERAGAFYACREQIHDDAVCSCFTGALEHFSPEHEAIDRDSVAKALRACVPTRPAPLAPHDI